MMPRFEGMISEVSAVKSMIRRVPKWRFISSIGRHDTAVSRFQMRIFLVRFLDALPMGDSPERLPTPRGTREAISFAAASVIGIALGMTAMMPHPRLRA